MNLNKKIPQLEKLLSERIVVLDGALGAAGAVLPALPPLPLEEPPVPDVNMFFGTGPVS